MVIKAINSAPEQVGNGGVRRPCEVLHTVRGRLLPSPLALFKASLAFLSANDCEAWPFSCMHTYIHVTRGLTLFLQHILVRKECLKNNTTCLFIRDG